MAGGWGSTIMQDEVSFIILDGFMVLIAVILLSFFAPGFLFPHMAAQMRSKKKSKKSKKSKGEKSSGSSGTPGDESQQDIEQGNVEAEPELKAEGDMLGFQGGAGPEQKARADMHALQKD